MSQRRLEIDYAKGFAILLMLLSHCTPGESKLSVWIFSFHMPIFFVICGILTAYKLKNGFKSTLTYLKTRCNQLLLPYFVFGLILIFLLQMLRFLGGQELTIGHQLFALISMQGVESLWFLPCYFLSELIFRLFYLKRSPVVQVTFTSLLVVLLCAMDKMGIPEFWLLQLIAKCLIGLVFIHVGFLFESIGFTKKSPLSLSLLAMGMCAVIAQVNGFVGISALQLQNVLLFFVNGSISSLALLSVFEHICQRQTRVLMCLEYFGKNTIIVVCTNNLCIELIRLLDHKLTGSILLKLDWIGSCIFFLILTVCEMCLIHALSRKRTDIFGRCAGL